MSEAKVLLMAIAKDEGAYLPEWIFHHLNIGIEGILIYVNSTTDNSCAILDKIGENHNVHYEVIDDKAMDEFDHLIDDKFLSRNAFQSRAYAHAYGNCDTNQYSHVLFMDIDEFFICPQNNINHLFPKLQSKAVTLFSWFNSTGDANDFSLLPNCDKGDKSWYTKYMVKTGAEKLSLQSTHIASVGDEEQELALEQNMMLKGEIYQGDIWTKNAFILHRYLRSKTEYISLLGRSDLYNKTMIGLKNNRKGWRQTFKDKVALPNELLNDYEVSFNNFIKENQLVDEQLTAQQFVIKRQQNVVEQIEKIRNLNNQLDQILYGSDVPHHDYSIKKLFIKLIKKHLGLDRPKHLV